MPVAQQVINNLEPMAPGRKVDAADIHDAPVLAVVMIPQEGHGRHNSRGRNIEGKLVSED